MHLKQYPHVSIVILNFNGYELTSTCLQSLKESSYPNYDVIVVDNASCDNSISKLKKNFSHCYYIENRENLGFAGGCNVGIRHALNTGTNYVLLLNNNTVVKKDFFETAIATAEKDDQIGIVGGKIYYYDEPTRIWSACGKISKLRGRGVHFGHNQQDSSEYMKPREVGMVSGALMLIKRVTIEKVGLLPEVYFFGAEEWDYSVSVANAGFKLQFVPDFVVWHKVGKSHERFDPQYVYNTYRNKLLFQKRLLSTFKWKLWFAVFLLYFKIIAPINLKIQMKGDGEGADFGAVLEAMKMAIVDSQTMEKVSIDDIEKIGSILCA